MNEPLPVIPNSRFFRNSFELFVYDAKTIDYCLQCALSDIFNVSSTERHVAFCQTFPLFGAELALDIHCFFYTRICQRNGFLQIFISRIYGADHDDAVVFVDCARLVNLSHTNSDS